MALRRRMEPLGKQRLQDDFEQGERPLSDPARISKARECFIFGLLRKAHQNTFARAEDHL